jgi:hypothetical protein
LENIRRHWLAKPFARLSVYIQPGATRTPLARKYKPMRSILTLTIAAALIVAATTPPALADVGCGQTAAVRVGVAPPPPLPETYQPPMPAYGDVWTPGSWAWNADINDYYWTPGAWILPPAIGLLWTPGYWGWSGGVYLYHAGYWGPHVGFYGGVRYGFGYWGHGYDGGYWQGRTFYYNRVYNNIGGLRINALYERRVPEDRLGSRVSFNGGPGGIVAAERSDEMLADRERHIAATAEQARHIQSAAVDPTMRASLNHGHPALAGAPAAAATHVVGAHVVSTHAHVVETHAAAPHVAYRHGAPSHGMYSPPAYQHPAAVQPHHDVNYNHYAPAYSHYAPAYGPPAHSQPPPLHVEPQHEAPPRPGPFHEGPPHDQRDHPHP